MAKLSPYGSLRFSDSLQKALKEYEQSKKRGEEPVFDPKKLNIKNADFWESQVS